MQFSSWILNIESWKLESCRVFKILNLDILKFSRYLTCKCVENSHSKLETSWKIKKNTSVKSFSSSYPFLYFRWEINWKENGPNLPVWRGLARPATTIFAHCAFRHPNHKKNIWHKRVSVLTSCLGMKTFFFFDDKVFFDTFENGEFWEK